MVNEKYPMNNVVNSTKSESRTGGIKHSTVGAVRIRKKTRNKSDVGPNFIAPDGGWGWFVCIAAGCSNLSVFPVLQQFGLLFRGRLQSLGLSSSQITTIINLNSSFTSCVGLLNGPMFRKLSYRQVGLLGASLAIIGLFLTSMSNSFITYLITFSILYGSGTGINSSANAVALNTYFKKKRRIATGLSWTVTALGPIVMPIIISILLPIFSVQGVVLILCGFSMHAIACALMFQPVKWHTKENETVDVQLAQQQFVECEHCSMMMSEVKNPSIFSSQYLYNSDSPSITGYEIIDPGTPMLGKSNDGWYSKSEETRKLSISGSKTSLASLYKSVKYDTYVFPSNRPSYTNLAVLLEREKRKELSNKIKIDELPTEDCPSHKATHDLLNIDDKNTVLSEPTSRRLLPAMKLEELSKKFRTDKRYSLGNGFTDDQMSKVTSGLIRSNTFNVERELLRNVSVKLEQYVHNKNRKISGNTCKCKAKVPGSVVAEDKDLNASAMMLKEDSKVSLCQKICIFFDLDLLKDLTYVNLMIGVTIANFSELNFSILTPFVLDEFGLQSYQIAFVMSLLGAMDITVRFFVPFVAGKIGWENKTFFLFGVLNMALGRIIIAHFQSYPAIIAACCWIGLNKGLRTVFMALVIPSHVPLNRLPGATGLQLLFAGLFYTVMGPIVGWVRDASNYTVTLHFLNITTYLTAISWGLEKFLKMRRDKSNDPDTDRVKTDT